MNNLNMQKSIKVYKSKHFIKILKDVGMTMPKSTGTRCGIWRQNSDGGMRNQEQH